uniref:A kinase-anchoring proteins AKAP-5 and AKAP-12 calmodulin (CaM)-binding domain-containing protein n=1 Tax=Mola mola TaxID=94237 RepID=A0A3Q3WQ66_MOLML
MEEPNTTEDTEDIAKGIRSEKAEQNTDENIAQETYDSTCPTLTDVTTDDILENAEKTGETKGDVESDNNATTVSLSEDKQQDEEEPHSTSPTNPEGEVVLSPTKRFFATGVFSGLRKKKKLTEEETTDKELEDMGGKDVLGRTEQPVQDKQQDKNVISPGLEAEHKDGNLKDENLCTASPQMTYKEKSLSRDPSAIVTEPEILSSQEKDKVQAGPVKRFLSGSSLKKLSIKRRSSRSNDATLSDSGEHVLDQLLLSESTENHKEGTAEAVREDDSAWASFKKRITPKRHSNASFLNDEETQIHGSVEESKLNKRGQISDQSTEGVKKRKDSSVSWEAVLCGSGRRRSRKTSDSDDEAPQIYMNVHKQDRGSKHSAESPLESSNDYEILASSPKQPEGPSEGDGGSAWKSLKRIVTPNRKVKDEEERIKGNVQFDNEVIQDDSSFLIKKLLPGRKKQKPEDKQDQVSSDEADKNVASGDEDSETPGVVPLSEFDTVETDVQIQTQEDTESRIPKDENYEIRQDEMPKPVLATSLQEIDNAGEKQEATTFATNKKTADLTESISKHQQLSDIPEEGIITEAMATPASFTEEPGRDDTIAEDLTEITSDAITATEPIPNITLAEKTEMISTFSQLSPRFSKASGNTTPLQAEYDIMETDTILHQAAETISISEKKAPLCSDDLNSEKTVASISHPILEAFVNNGPTILELDRGFDATAIKTDLKVEEIDAVNELAAASIKESISEVQDLVSTEVVSEVSTKESETAEIVADELQLANITHQKESAHELESIEESSHLVERLDADASADTLSEADKIILQVCSRVEPHQAEAKPPKIDIEEAYLTATVSDESKDGATGQVETLKEKEDQILQSHITNQIQVEDKEKPSINVEELQELSKDKVTTLDSEGSNEPLEREVKLEDMLTDESETKKVETEHIKANEALQASPLNSDEANVQSPEEKVKSEDTPLLETVIDEPKQMTELLSIAETDKKEPPVKPEHVQQPEVLQATSLDSEESSIPSLEKEVQSENIPKEEKVTEEPKEETLLLAQDNLEPVGDPKTVQEPDVLQIVQAPLLDSEEGNIQLLDKDMISENVSKAETVTDKPKEELMLLTEANLEPVDVSNTAQDHQELQDTQEPPLNSEEGIIQTCEKEVISDTHSKAETVTDEPKDETSRLTPVNLEPVDASETVQEPKELQDAQAATFSSEAGSPLSLKIGAQSEDITVETVADQPKQDNKNKKVVSEEKLEVEECKTEHAVHESYLNEELSNVQVLGKTVCYGDTSAPCVNNAAVTDEPKQEVNLTTQQISVEQEKESGPQGIEMKTVAVEQALLPQMVQNNLNDVSEAVPDILIEKTPEMTEPSTDTVAAEQVFNEEVQGATTLMKDDVAGTAEKGNVVVMMQVPSVKLEDNHSIEMQVVDETSVDPAVKAGVIEAKHAIDVCCETIEKLDTLSATTGTKKEVIHEEVTVVRQDVKDTVPESLVGNLEQEDTKNRDSITRESEMAGCESREMDYQTAVEDSTEKVLEQQDEEPTTIGDSAPEQQVSTDVIQKPDIQGDSDFSSHDHIEDLEETNAELEKNEEDIAVEKEGQTTSEDEQAPTTQIKSPTLTSNNTELVVSQNTGIVSSNGNVDVQFGDRKSPASPQATAQIIAPVIAPEVGVQAVEADEPVKPINPTQQAESKKQTKTVAVAVQVTEIMIDAAQLSVSIQATKAVRPVEEITSSDRVTSSVQATETTQSVRQTEQKELCLGQQALSETKAEEPVKQTEKDRDVRMDVEKVVYTQEETEESFCDEEEPPEHQKASEEGDKPELGHEVGTVKEDFAVAVEHPEKGTTSITNKKSD